MPRRRRSHRISVYRPLKTAKYSNETFAYAVSREYNEAQPNYVVVSASTNVLGTRKAKNFTLNFTTSGDSVFFYCLVFVPEGTSPGELNATTSINNQYISATSFYEPNQNVILSGIATGGSAGVVRAKTRLARNLNSGDRLILIYRPITPFEGSRAIVGTLNYAISY